MSTTQIEEDAPPVVILDSKSQESNQPLLNLRSTSSIPVDNKDDNNVPGGTSSKKIISQKQSPSTKPMPIATSTKSSPQANPRKSVSCELLKYTCFSCCFMGNIVSEFERENKLKWMESSSYCQECAMGTKGCEQCAGMFCLVGIGFPISPCFSCYLLRERWKLQLFYPYDTRLPSMSTLVDYCYYSCCWMKNLQEQHTFIQQLKKEGNLTFAWDYQQYHDQLTRQKVHTIKPYQSNTLLSFGPNTPLKQQFLRKLLMQTNNIELSQLNAQYPLLNEIHHIQTGIRSIVNEHTNEINFLEIWDIPMNHFHSPFIQQIEKQANEKQQLDPVFVSLYLFDVNDYLHFNEMKQVFNQYEYLMNKPRIIIILKDPTGALSTISNKANNISSNTNTHSIYQMNQNSTENLLMNGSQQSIDKISLEAEILTWAKRQGVIWYHVSVFDEYSYVVLNKQIMKLIPKNNK